MVAARRARGLPLGTPRDMSAYAARAAALGRAANAAKARARAKEIAPVLAAATAVKNAQRLIDSAT